MRTQTRAKNRLLGLRRRRELLLLLLGEMRWAQARVKLLLWLLRLLPKRTVRRLLVEVHVRERVLGERLVHLGVDEVRGVQRLLLVLLLVLLRILDLGRLAGLCLLVLGQVRLNLWGQVRLRSRLCVDWRRKVRLSAGRELLSLWRKMGEERGLRVLILSGNRSGILHLRQLIGNGQVRSRVGLLRLNLTRMRLTRYGRF
jgi:hypothetical protein